MGDIHTPGRAAAVGHDTCCREQGLLKIDSENPLVVGVLQEAEGDHQRERNADEALDRKSQRAMTGMREPVRHGSQ